MTYEGSTTYPGCWETVTWIVMNKPIYISRPEMYALKQLMQGDKINPKSTLAPNSRPIQEGHNRSVRTNIYFPAGGGGSSSSSSPRESGLVSSEGSMEECPDVFENFNYAAGTLASPWKPDVAHFKIKVVVFFLYMEGTLWLFRLGIKNHHITQIMESYVLNCAFRDKNILSRSIYECKGAK